MKRILQVAPNITVKGGISTVLKMYLKTDLPCRYDIGFVVTHEDGTKFHKYVVMLIGIVRFILILLSKRIDIVHIHCGDIPSPYRKYFFFKISRWFRLSVVLHWHGGNFLRQYKNASPFWKRRLKTLFERSDVVICLSQFWSEELGLLFPKSNRIVVRNGIVPPDLTHSARIDSSGPTRIVFLGWLIPEKGLFDLLIVFERLLKEGYDIYLYIGGKGDVAKLKECISSHYLKDRVHYLGWIGDRRKDRLLRSSDIFTLPSYGEAMPMSVLEAMAYGLPVISTRVGAIPEQIEEAVSGFLLTPGDLEGLYNRLKVLISNNNLRIQMGRNGRRKVEKSFDIRQNCKAISQAYDKLQTS